MSDKLHATIQRNEAGQSVKLAGVIDEDNRLVELADKVSTGRALIDLGDVERINSCGTRDWVNWIAQLETRGIQPVLVECSPAIVAQLNLVKNFAGNAIVKSFYVPYHCPECDEEKVLLVEVADLGPPPHEPPTCRCDECETMMDFDDMPSVYFAFLSHKHRASAQELDKEVARGSTPSMKLRARTSQPVLATRASSPSLPSLPSLSRSGSQPALPARASTEPRSEIAPPPPTRGISGPVLFLILALVLAIAALGYLVATG